MEKPSRNINWIVWGGLAVVIAGIIGVFAFSRATSGKPLPVYGQVSDFALTNQLGQPVSFDALRGKIWVANVIFTRCPGPCVRMTRQMAGFQSTLPRGVHFLSLTADPEFDTPEVLSRYANQFGADHERWQFLTGDKQQLYRLATKDLMLAVVETDPDQREVPEDMFVHSTLFVLIDKRGRLRGIYESEPTLYEVDAPPAGAILDPSFEDRVLAGVRRLLRER